MEMRERWNRREFRRLLRRRGLRPIDFARISGIHKSTLSLYASGRRVPDNSMVARIMTVLDSVPELTDAEGWWAKWSLKYLRSKPKLGSRERLQLVAYHPSRIQKTSRESPASFSRLCPITRRQRPLKLPGSSGRADEGRRLMANSPPRSNPRNQRNNGELFVGVPDGLFSAIIGNGPVGQVIGAVAYEQRRRKRLVDANDAVPISGQRFVSLTGMSRTSLYRALAEARNQELLVVARGGGSGKRSLYRLSPKLFHGRDSSTPGELSQSGAKTVPPAYSHKEVDSAPPSVSRPKGASVPSEKAREAGSLYTAALEMLALGVPVYLHRWHTQKLLPEAENTDSREIIECLPDDDGVGKVSRLLGGGHDRGFALAAKIKHKPTGEVLSGREQPSPLAHLPEGDWSIKRVLKRFQDQGIALRRKPGNRWVTRCPACTGTFFITARASGKTSVKCQASGDEVEAMRIVGLTIHDLYQKERADLG